MSDGPIKLGTGCQACQAEEWEEMGIKDTEQDRTMMDGPEHSSHTGEGGRDERNGGGHTEKMEIYVGKIEGEEREG